MRISDENCTVVVEKFGNLKPAIHLYSIQSICPNTGVSLTHSSKKIRHVIHLKLQSALAVGESDVLSPSTAGLRFPPISPTQQISDKGSLVARSQSSQIV
ncbi:hypothetical protein AVEN_101168-1 [Araneus ventricosus]|uniref:Uncharacterized protein n=1 Tax=Araneus ventricosus TaxID=182803 RepID=A0A4Y2DEM7_ARAVE|nr:hypothetical protein AVEN_101168-1 [Araneus ventricosus]